MWTHANDSRNLKRRSVHCRLAIKVSLSNANKILILYGFEEEKHIYSRECHLCQANQGTE
jgi:hypothetical protein